MAKKRKVKTVEQAVKRNHPELRKIEDFGKPKPEYVVNLVDAGRRIRYAVRNKQHIFLFADYDADGICSAAEFAIIFKELKIPEDGYTIRFPHRFTEGYGMQPEAVDEVPDGALVITVDNGIAAYEAVKKAKDRGLDVIVIDHHPLNEGLEYPPADIIVDPNAVEGGSFSDYCGAGLTLKLAQFLIGTKVRSMQRIEGLAAIATIADVVALRGDNWIIARSGMELLRKGLGVSSGLKAILTKAGCGGTLTEEDLGFKIIPQFNAPGRLYDNGAEIVYKAVSFDGPYPVARDMADKLSGINEERKKEVDAGMKAAKKKIESLPSDAKAVVLYLPGVGEGIAGIIAGRIAEEEKKPAFVLTDPKFPKESGILKGSGRSACGINLKDALKKTEPFLKGYGGHPGAAGISLLKTDLNRFTEALNHAVPPVNPDAGSEAEPDMEISVSMVPEVVKAMEKYAPYGEGNPPVVVTVPDLESRNVRTMGTLDEHLRIDADGLNAVAFFANPEWISKARQAKKAGKTVSVTGTLSKNHYRGRDGKEVVSTQMNIKSFSVNKNKKL